MYRKIIFLVFINLLISFGYNQNTNRDIYTDPGEKIIHVINLSEQFAIESQIDPDKYILGPSDKLGLNIIGSENKTYILSITPTGEILIPQVGSIHISGNTLSEAKVDIDTFVKRNAFSNARVELIILNIMIVLYLVLALWAVGMMAD